MTRWAGLLICAIALGFVVGSQVAQRHQLKAEDIRPAPRDNKVTEADIELYIAVYSAMQSDHGLTIDDALATRKVTIEEFRDVERRVQTDQRTVDKVRLALLNQAKSRNWGPPGIAAAPPPKADAGEPKK